MCLFSLIFHPEKTTAWTYKHIDLCMYVNKVSLLCWGLLNCICVVFLPFSIETSCISRSIPNIPIVKLSVDRFSIQCHLTSFFFLCRFTFCHVAWALLPLSLTLAAVCSSFLYEQTKENQSFSLFLSRAHTQNKRFSIVQCLFLYCGQWLIFNFIRCID